LNWVMSWGGGMIAVNWTYCWCKTWNKCNNPPFITVLISAPCSLMHQVGRLTGWAAKHTKTAEMQCSRSVYSAWSAQMALVWRSIICGWYTIDFHASTRFDDHLRVRVMDAERIGQKALVLEEIRWCLWLDLDRITVVMVKGDFWMRDSQMAYHPLYEWKKVNSVAFSNVALTP
jgi:hypothetical protein